MMNTTEMTRIGQTTWSFSIPPDTAVALQETYGISVSAGRLELTIDLHTLQADEKNRFVASIMDAQWNGNSIEILNEFSRGGKLTLKHSDTDPMVAVDSLCMHFAGSSGFDVRTT